MNKTSVQMTSDEFMDKFGTIKAKFKSYYKYCFVFESTDGSVTFSVGGGSDDIYKFDVQADREYSVLELGPPGAQVGEVYYENGEQW